MQWGFYFDQTRCCGCYTCILACQQWHNTQVNWRWVKTLEEGAFPHVRVSFLSLSCLHCDSPACVSSCPTDALWKREEEGIVLFDKERCLGKDDCGQCLEACPYQAIRFENDAVAKVEKCDLCWERIREGDKPLCVAACITRALDAGPLDELRERYGDQTEAKDFIYDKRLRPSIVFKSR
ncbi:MAG: 4Fe-4S dicluster domain-containing protein [Pseudomonadota bacterium]